MAPSYLLDTNVISDLIRHPQGVIAGRIATAGEDAMCTSIVVAAELRFGAQKSGSARIAERVGLILSAMNVLALEPPVDQHYGDIRQELTARSELIGPNDLFIAAHARALDLILVTVNVREFLRVSGLKVENWRR